MSYNSKRTRKAAMKAQFKRASGAGGKAQTESRGPQGPAKTTKVNKKKNTWYGKLAGKPTAPAKPKQEELAVE